MISVRKRKLLKGVMAGIGPVQAAREAGYSETTATRGVTALMASAPFRAALGQSMRRAGITDKRLWAGIDAGLDAKETKFFAEKVTVTDSREIIAWGPRHQHLETALRLKGYLGRESADDDGDAPRVGVQVVVLGWPEAPEAIPRAIVSGDSGEGIADIIPEQPSAPTSAK